MPCAKYHFHLLNACWLCTWYKRKYFYDYTSNIAWSCICFLAKFEEKIFCTFFHKKIVLHECCFLVVPENIVLGLRNQMVETCFHRIKWGAFSRCLSSLYCPMWNSDQMTFGKTHPLEFSGVILRYFSKNVQNIFSVTFWTFLGINFEANYSL